MTTASESELSAGNLERLAEILRATGHPVRLALLAELFRSPCCVSDIHRRLGISQPVASQHLAILRNCRLVSFEKEGASRCYALANPGVVRGILDIVTAEKSL